MVLCLAIHHTKASLAENGKIRKKSLLTKIEINRNKMVAETIPYSSHIHVIGDIL